MTHGYMFSGSGSNVYVQNLCRALVRGGHEVHLLCQEPDPLSYDFVDAHATADAGGTGVLGERSTPYPGRCVVYNPVIGDLLPVYVYDEYPGWRVKTFLDLTQEELDLYLEANAAALETVARESGAPAAVTNHSVPGPLIARRALGGLGVPYVSIVHGSCLQYVARRSPLYMELAREGLAGARRILALSRHSAGTIAEDFPHLAGRTISFPGGVDTDLFRPDALDPALPRELRGGAGRGPEQARALLELQERGPETPGELAERLASIAATYDARAHDRDAGERLERLFAADGPLVVYVGKLIHSKGVHVLLQAFARVRRRTGARLLVVGFGTFREALQALTLALGTGDGRLLSLVARSGRLLEGGVEAPLEHFEPGPGLLREAEGMHEDVEFIGPLYHEDLARLLPAAEVSVVPSIFPETFGLVAAEEAASGVVPFVANHSGLSEAAAIIGKGLPFPLAVGMEDFGENLARALIKYLGLPEEERRLSRETVRRNCVEHLGWERLAGRLVRLCAGEE
ncbi:glycosyltransferase [Rubrobacter naiadicus]|uniref:glycosyltransferase n=1 Tax=Rubrobacter naiadicus TaxID=1392641 RepID=UPI0023611F3A|nr:glycosyltransferase [Rubrobacter naiadicus]